MDTNTEKTYEYETKSLDEFAVALSIGAEITKVDRVKDPKFYTFYLKHETIDIEKIALQLASRTLTVNAYELCEAMRRAKSVIHSR